MTAEQVAERRRKGLERFLEEAVRPHLDPDVIEILDVGCGRGWGLKKLQSFVPKPVGLDSDFKLAAMEPRDVEIEIGDMHKLPFDAGRFHAIVSSHSLEHAKVPAQALAEWQRVTKPHAQAFVVLPYPDTRRNNPLHVGRFQIGTHVEDHGLTVRKFFQTNGWNPEWMDFDDYREQEIWLRLRKIPGSLVSHG